MASAWIFGIDGGGTNARLRVEDLGGRQLFYGEGGSTNIRSNPREQVLVNLAGLFSRAYDEAGLDPSGCLAGFAGSAGVDRPADRAGFADLVRQALAAPSVTARIEVGNDAEPALAGAIGDVEGILLIAGTGSIAYGRTRGGADARAGGWGHLLGDEGSAFWIAFEALKRGMRSKEGRDLESGLLAAGLGFFGLALPGDLVPFVYDGIDKTNIARFARVVGTLRDHGDPLAIDIFRQAAHELAALVFSVDSRVGSQLIKKRLALRGGLIEGDAVLRSAVTAELEGRMEGLEIINPIADGAAGACLIARSLISS